VSMATAEAVLERLAAGNARFVADETTGEGRDHVRRAALTGGQSPWAIVLSCADSRVAPELLFDTGLGELFVIRVAGNVANTSSIASIEYAIAHMGTPVIVVLGHQGCGAVTAALAGGDNGTNLNHLLAHITEGLNVEDAPSVESAVRSNATHVAQELRRRSQIIVEAVNAGRLRIAPAIYSLDDGSVSWV
jgi:carbonic anhydrase